MSSTRGVLYVHSSPSALCPHVEWAAGGVFGIPIGLQWSSQPLERNSYRCSYSWSGPAGTAAGLASALKGWDRIRFEVSEEPSLGCEGSRYSYTPRLGIFHATTGWNGDILVHEDRLKHAVVGEALGGKSLADRIGDLLGAPWDDELEAFRHAGDLAPVRWLHQVV